MPALKGNRNAAKPEGQKLSGALGSILRVRCFAADLAKWKHKAGGNLSAWVVKALNKSK